MYKILYCAYGEPSRGGDGEHINNNKFISVKLGKYLEYRLSFPLVDVNRTSRLLSKTNKYRGRPNIAESFLPKNTAILAYSAALCCFRKIRAENRKKGFMVYYRLSSNFSPLKWHNKSVRLSNLFRGVVWTSWLCCLIRIH